MTANMLHPKSVFRGGVGGVGLVYTVLEQIEKLRYVWLGIYLPDLLDV